MAYLDPSRNFATVIQTGFGSPNVTFNNFYRVIEAGPVFGELERDPDPRVNTAGFARPSKGGKVKTEFTVQVPLTVLDGIKELLSCIGAVAVANPVAGVYQHTGTFSRAAANTRYFSMQADIDGVIAHIVDARVHGFRIEAPEGGPYPIVTLRCVGTWPSNVDWIPTAVAGPATYNGIVYTTGTDYTDGSSSLSYIVDVDGAGAIDGTATVRSHLSTDGANWSPSVAPRNDVPFPIYSATGGTVVDSGIRMIWGVGANNLLAVGDQWSVGNRDTVASGTVSSASLLSWNSAEFDILLENGSTFTPLSFFVDLDLNLRRDLFVGGRKVPQSFPVLGPAKLACGFSLVDNSPKFMNLFWANAQRSLRLRARGNQIGTTAYFEEVDIKVNQYRLTTGTRSINQDFLIQRDIEGGGHGSTPLVDDAITIIVQNDQASMTT